MPSQFTRIVLNERPPGDIDSKTFRSEKVSYSGLNVGEDQVLVQVTWLSLDPAMRGWLKDERSYLPPVQIGEIMRSAALGVVIEKGKSVNL